MASYHPTCAAEFFIFNSVSFVILKVLEELSHVELFKSVLIDKRQQETEIFNYFAKVSHFTCLNETFFVENEHRRLESGS